MKKLKILLFILFLTNNLLAQITLASYQALNTTVYNAIDGSIEFTPTGTNNAPTNNQFLSIPSNSSYEFTGDFTVECWVNFKNISGVYQSFLGHYTGGTPWILQLQPNKTLRLTGSYGSDITLNTLSANTWYHIAIVRIGFGLNCLKIYVNGIQSGQATITGTFGSSNQNFTLGSGTQGNNGGNDRFNGFISNLRIVKGSGVYTSNFTPPTSRLTNIAGTTLLMNTTNDAKYIKDNSTNNVTVSNINVASTTAGLSTSSPLNPFNFLSTGLIVNLDATDSSSYPGSGTIWANLGTGGTTYNATLTNSPTHTAGISGNLFFNKATSGDLQQYGTISINTGTMNAWSMEVIAKISNKSLWSTTPFVTIADVVGYNQRQAYIGVQGGTINYSPAGGNFQSYQITDDTWYIVTVVHSSGIDALYLNGVLQGLYNNVNNNNPMGTNGIIPLYLGNPPNNNSNSIQQVKISRFKFYSRALNNSEIGSNFSIQRSRYGL